jgi:hypothetical protein
MNEKQTKNLKELITQIRLSSYTLSVQNKISDAEVLGLIVSRFLKWTPNDILKTIYSALEDANMHELNKEILKLI